MMVSINNQQYPIVGKINMNATMVNLGSATNVKSGDRAIIFGWRTHEPKLNDLAQLSGQIIHPGKEEDENTNGRLRRFLPRTAEISKITQAELDKLSKNLNNTP